MGAGGCEGVVEEWPVRLHLVAEPSSLMAGAIELLSCGRAPLRSPWESFAMQLDRESAVALRGVLAVPPPALVPPDLEAFRQELLDRLDVFLISHRGSRRTRRRQGTTPGETVLYPRSYIEAVESRRAAGMLAAVATMFPAVRSATVIDTRQWLLLRLDRGDALRIRDALLREPPPEDAREIADRYVERLSEMIDVPYAHGGAWA